MTFTMGAIVVAGESVMRDAKGCNEAGRIDMSMVHQPQ